MYVLLIGFTGIAFILAWGKPYKLKAKGSIWLAKVQVL